MEPIKVETIDMGSETKKSMINHMSSHVWNLFAKTNLFALCCIGAFLSLVTYLGAFSCEVSWILEAHGDLPMYAYLLCSGYFIMFIASTILIHGLATGLSWGLFSWSAVVGVLSIPELIFVMIMTTQFWGLQSIHGLTEIITYLIRLVINSTALLCVIPTALRWRRERQILSQLENLATRLHMQSPDIPAPLSPAAASAAISRINDSMRRRKRRPSQSSGYDNPTFIGPPTHPNSKQGHQPQITLPIFSYMYGMYPSQNEFNASIFGLDPSHLIGMPPMMQPSKRTQSLLDFRHIIPTQMTMQSNTPITDLDAPDGRTQNMENQQTLNNNGHNTMSINSQHHNDNGNGINHTNPMQMQMRTECNNRKISIPLIQNKRQNSSSNNNNNNNDDSEKHSMAGDPIYQTISSEKGGAKSLRRNCISLENLRTLTIKNDLNSYGNNLLQNQIGHNPQSQFYILPAYPPPPLNYHIPYFNPKPQLVYGPPPPMHMMQHLKAPNRRTPFANYGGFTNPNPYSNLSNGNSRQSIGNDSDDYRKYRDVAL